jgi:TBC1 domain family member 20
MLHSVLCKLPKPLNLESLISKAVALFELHPPESLSAWRWISSNSVLKTSRYPQHFTNQTLEDGVRYYKKQVVELERAELRRYLMSMIWKYRRPACTIGLAVMVGLLAWWMRRNGGGNQFIGNRGAFGALVRWFWQH